MSLRKRTPPLIVCLGYMARTIFILTFLGITFAEEEVLRRSGLAVRPGCVERTAIKETRSPFEMSVSETAARRNSRQPSGLDVRDDRPEAPPHEAERSEPGYGRLTFRSSDELLNKAFEWAKRQALGYVFRGDPVGDWYEAALPKREAFCMRDVSHQAAGANALGLQAFNKNMFRRFAENISEAKDWCTYWEINRYNKPAPVDYRNDREFWYNLPSNFDVLDAMWRQYLWTGDKDYLDDPVFLNFYERSVKDYVERWELTPEKIMARKPFMNLAVTLNPEDSFHTSRGLPSYNEDEPGMNVGADLPAAQGAAYAAYANIRRLRREAAEADRFFRKAIELKDFFHRTWWNAEKKVYAVFHYPDGRFGTGIGQEFLLYWGATAEGTPTRQAIENMLNLKNINIEMRSYYPEIFYRNGENTAAYRTILYLCDETTPRREYPEVSYAVIGAISQGMMGVEADARDGVVATLARLPNDWGDEDWAEVRDVPVLNSVIGLKHSGLRATEFRNMGLRAMIWRASFQGKHDKIAVAGIKMKAEHKTATDGRVISFVTVPVKPGDTLRASIK